MVEAKSPSFTILNIDLVSCTILRIAAVTLTFLAAAAVDVDVPSLKPVAPVADFNSISL